jgi:hypothetical protein
MILTKTATTVDVVATSKGGVVAVLGSLSGVDLDLDTYDGPGAIVPREVVLSAWNHDAAVGTALPVGKGRIDTRGDQIVFDGAYFDTPRGRETYAVIRELGPLSEWSWSMAVTSARRGERAGKSVRIIERAIPLEASAVLRGAGLGTGTETTEETAAKEYLRFVRTCAGLDPDDELRREYRRYRALTGAL